MKNNDEPRLRLGAKNQYESFILHKERVAESWADVDDLISNLGINPEEAMNTLELFFEEALKKLGLPIVGMSTSIKGGRPPILST